MIKKILTHFSVTLLIIIAAFLFLLFTGVIWRSPSSYKVTNHTNFSVPIMDMKAYDTLGYHPRPYIYKIESDQGSVFVLGIEHTRDPNNPQIDSIRVIWDRMNPDVALVEGRLGFLFSWFQDPVLIYSEGGETVHLAKRDNTPFYTWEPDKETEVGYMLKEFEPTKVALFYSLRPYFSNFRFGKPGDPDEVMLGYIQSRTDVDGLRGYITNVAQVDSIWKSDFSGLDDWRDTSDKYGWPEGYLSEMANYSNLIRDQHMCASIVDLVNRGKKVFITMGSSHAFRIEKTLKSELLK